MFSRRMVTEAKAHSIDDMARGVAVKCIDDAKSGELGRLQNFFAFW